MSEQKGHRVRACWQDAITSLKPHLLAEIEPEVRAIFQAVRPNFSLALMADEALSLEEMERLNVLVEQRKSGKPLSKILGRKAFWNHEFLVNEVVLDPRPESELLVQAALDFARSQKKPALNILDLGTGSGCLLLSVLCELQNSKGLGLDCSLAALDVARRNGTGLERAQPHLKGRYQFVRADWNAGLSSLLKDSGFDGGFDLILANPPYIDPAHASWMDAGVLDYDPHVALFAEKAGFAAYEVLFEALPGLLKPQGLALFEHGFDQQATLIKMADEHDLDLINAQKDLAGHTRMLALSVAS